MQRASNLALAQARSLLGVLEDERPAASDIMETATDLAAALMRISAGYATHVDTRRRKLLARLMRDTRGQAFTLAFTDRICRSARPERVVEQARYLLETLGTPAYLPAPERLLLGMLRSMGQVASDITADQILRRLRRETAGLVLPGAPEALKRYLEKRGQEGVRINLNQLGEAVLGEEEAERRVARYVALLERPEIDCVSVKISSIASQLDPLAWKDSLAQVEGRLRSLYRAAMAHSAPGPDGQLRTKLVTLDMEAYNELQLTAAAFRNVMSEPEFLPLTAGIVLQAYLPDSGAVQQALTQWAMGRCAEGGAPIRLRIVKGANLAMEQVESSAHGWPCPVYASKAEVDAHYKAMLRFGCMPSHAAAVHLGLGSHNVFDIAYGLCLRAVHGVQAQVGFELLEGMADPLRKALQDVAGDVLLYAPTVDEAEFQTAIAYLVRRLDENTGPENFLRNSFDMSIGDAAWQHERQRFLDACAPVAVPGEHPLRTQDRRETERQVADAVPDASEPFTNEPDTDFTLLHNRAWIETVLQRWRRQDDLEVRAQIAGRDLDRPLTHEGFDPSRPGYVAYRYGLAQADDLERALTCADEAKHAWAALPLEERVAVIGAAAQVLRRSRGDLIGAMVLDGGKAVRQADPEVSEAIDFAEWYRRGMLEAAQWRDVECRPKGVVLVTPPWNFPLAIAAGGVFAALVAGNAVLLKPPPETLLVGRLLAELCWDAGVPREVLQLIICEDTLGSNLVRDARVDAVILTGGTATARAFRRMRADLDLMAETGGKNSLIVSAMSDRDLAVRDLVLSAFRHSGQKCSAASLAICEAEVYEDPSFVRQLKDAAESLPTGSAWDFHNVVTPLIRAPESALLRGLTTLEEGETWLVEPRRHPDNGNLWSPGVKWGVRPNTFMHQTELFGPVLGVMRAAHFEHAMTLANGTAYGLTAGLHSLDEREQRRWARRMQAGNLYINRGITGAIVRRQPFGGFKASSFGPGAKAGGHNYVLQMVHVTQRKGALPDGLAGDEAAVPAHPRIDALLRHLRGHLFAESYALVEASARSYALAWRDVFSRAEDPSQVLGEDNLLRYVPCSRMRIYADARASVHDVVRSCLAALTCGTPFVLTMVPELAQKYGWLFAMPGVLIEIGGPDALRAALDVAPIERIRAIGVTERSALLGTDHPGLHVETAPVLHNGRIELLRYLREQSLTVTYHRHGNLTRIDTPWSAEPGPGPSAPPRAPGNDVN